MTLRVAAVSAPELPESRVGRLVLGSNDPASLFNACRYGALLAERGTGAWGDSNWAVPRARRRESVLLMHSFRDDLPLFERMLLRERPNLLLLGAMTICYPGAIACARFARQLLGDKVCIVLGGRHALETLYRDRTGGIEHHPGSPLRQMAAGLLDPCFDLVLAGEGEHFIPWLGERVASLERAGRPMTEIHRHLEGVDQVPGRWHLGWMEDDGRIRVVEGRRPAFDRNAMPVPSEMFGVRTAFDVFGGRLTAHVFSDTGGGCAYDCSFCSERRSIAGPLVQLESSAGRLFRQLDGVCRVVAEDHPGRKASAFVEDSTLLAGSNTALRQLVDLLEATDLDIRFGGQLTLDQILSRGDLLRDLKSVGLDYLFIGIETFDPESIGGMSKDLGGGQGRWMHRTERALEMLSEIGIRVGAAILFGLGEPHPHRLKLLRTLEEWRRIYGSPDPVSFNWAVQHPLQGMDGGTGYLYQDWAIPAGPWLEAFEDFGEASVCYPLAGQKPPHLEEVLEIRRIHQGMAGGPEAVPPVELPWQGAEVAL